MTNDAARADTDDSRFWAEAHNGRLVFQHCDRCEFVRWPAAGTCPECLSRDFTWRAVESTGTVWSYVVYHRAYSPAFADQLPYNVALIELDCGVRLLSRLVGLSDGEDPVGARVSASFADLGGDHGVVPVFALLRESVRD